ncbi:MAG: flagellar basal-body rod protein FlgB [Sulfitobacter sp.]|jgi:flagellar basal-body rod protein FlgB
MFENLDLFRMSSAMARYAGQKQAITAQNVANADTPGYAARDLPEFKLHFDPEARSGHPRATREKHLNGIFPGRPTEGVTEGAYEVRDNETPNGNKVSLETEMLKSVSAKRQHDQALAIYKTALGILRSTIRT